MKSSGRIFGKMTVGYIVGGLLVLIIMPSIIFLVTRLVDNICIIDVIHNNGIKLVISFILLLIGFSFGMSSIIYQNVIGKGGPVEISNIEISPKTRYLVTTGPYRYTRNPMLFGTFLIYLAEAVLINSLTAFIIVIIFIIFMLAVVVKKEEKRLLEDFGNQYIKYRNNTSMIIPWFPKKGKETNGNNE